MDHAGEDVSEIFRGSHGGGGHEHSAAAHRILHRLRVGRVALDPPRSEGGAGVTSASAHRSAEGYSGVEAGPEAGAVVVESEGERARRGTLDGLSAGNLRNSKSSSEAAAAARAWGPAVSGDTGDGANRAASECSGGGSGGGSDGGSDSDGEQAKSSVGSVADADEAAEVVFGSGQGATGVEGESGAGAGAGVAVAGAAGAGAKSEAEAGAGAAGASGAQAGAAAGAAAAGASAAAAGSDAARQPSVAFGIDPSAPLVAQVGFLGDQYMEWVHIPEVTAAPLRFFANPVMEALSRTVWWAVGPVTYCPTRRPTRF